jgi:hypothetical protein
MVYQLEKRVNGPLLEETKETKMGRKKKEHRKQKGEKKGGNIGNKKGKKRE